MSKHSKRHSTSPRSQPRQTRRSPWLAATALTLAGVALVSMLIWLVQRNTAETAQITAPAQVAPSDSTAFSGPRISVDQDRFDYGNVKLNTTIETAVRVRNTGHQELALEQNPVVELIEGC